MPRYRSLLPNLEVDEAKRAHDCQGNSNHRIHKGEQRLSVRNGRNWDRYCCECARKIISRDSIKLDEIAKTI